MTDLPTPDAEAPAPEKKPRTPRARAAEPTPPPPPVAVLLHRVMSDVGAVKKDQYNSQQKFAFRGVDAVVNAVYPALVTHGLVVLPRLVTATRGTSTARSGNVQNTVVVEVEYAFHGPAGDRLVVGPIPGEAFDAGDKATAKAMSVAYRTMWLETLALPTDEEDPDHQVVEAVRTPDGVDPDSPDIRTAATRVHADVVSIVDNTAPGDDRVRQLRGKWTHAGQLGVLQVHVPVPESWGVAPGTTATISDLINGAQGVVLNTAGGTPA